MKHSFFIILFVLTLTGAISAHATGPTVTIRAAGYDSMLLAIEPGTTVSWFNSDSRPHSVTADDGSFDSGGINASFGGWSHTFTMVGRYAYHDGGDPSHTGLVIVGDAPVLTTYLPLVQAAPPLPPPLNQLMLQYPDISSAFARTALEVIPGTADDNYEAYLYVA